LFNGCAIQGFGKVNRACVPLGLSLYFLYGYRYELDGWMMEEG